MDPQIIDTVYSGLIGYGGVGLVAVYFMVKDWKVSKEINETLAEFRAVLEVVKDRVGILGKDKNE